MKLTRTIIEAADEVLVFRSLDEAGRAIGPAAFALARPHLEADGFWSYRRGETGTPPSETKVLVRLTPDAWFEAAFDAANGKKIDSPRILRWRLANLRRAADAAEPKGARS